MQYCFWQNFSALRPKKGIHISVCPELKHFLWPWYCKKHVQTCLITGGIFWSRLRHFTLCGVRARGRLFLALQFVVGLANPRYFQLGRGQGILSRALLPPLFGACLWAARASPSPLSLLGLAGFDVVLKNAHVWKINDKAFFIAFGTSTLGFGPIVLTTPRWQLKSFMASGPWPSWGLKL